MGLVRLEGGELESTNASSSLSPDNVLRFYVSCTLCRILGQLYSECRNFARVRLSPVCPALLVSCSWNRITLITLISEEHICYIPLSSDLSSECTTGHVLHTTNPIWEPEFSCEITEWGFFTSFETLNDDLLPWSTIECFPHLR